MTELLISGTRVPVSCLSGRVSKIEDKSYDRHWNEHTGTDTYWRMVPNGRGGNEMLVEHQHYYVQKSERVERRFVTVDFDQEDGFKRSGLGSDTVWLDGGNVALGDEISFVKIGYSPVAYAIHTRGYIVRGGELSYPLPTPQGFFETIGSAMEGWWPVTVIAVTLASGFLPYVFVFGVFGRFALEPALYGFAASSVFGVVCAMFWRHAQTTLRDKVRAAVRDVIRRDELVRQGASLREANEATLKAHGLVPEPAPIAPVERTIRDVKEPWWVPLVERLGAEVLPPVDSAEHYRPNPERVARKKAGEEREKPLPGLMFPLSMFTAIPDRRYPNRWEIMIPALERRRILKMHRDFLRDRKKSEA